MKLSNYHVELGTSSIRHLCVTENTDGPVHHTDRSLYLNISFYFQLCAASAAFSLCWILRLFTPDPPHHGGFKPLVTLPSSGRNV